MGLDEFIDSVARSRKNYLLALAGLAVVSGLISFAIALISKHSLEEGISLTLLAAITVSQLLAFRRLGQTTSLGVVWRLFLAFFAEWAVLAWDGDAFSLSVAALNVVALIARGSREAAGAPAPAAPTVPTEAPNDLVPDVGESPSVFVKRKGWQMPGLQKKPDGSPASAQYSAVGPRFSTMKDAVFGHVKNKEHATLSTGKSNVPIVTLRIERNDPHAGLDFVSVVRLSGPSAVGFADLGDLVEATGRKQSAYVLARRCINHTTGAIYKGGGVNFGAWFLRVIVTVVFLVILATFPPTHIFITKIGLLLTSWMH